MPLPWCTSKSMIATRLILRVFGTIAVRAIGVRTGFKERIGAAALDHRVSILTLRYSGVRFYDRSSAQSTARCYRIGFAPLKRTAVRFTCGMALGRCAFRLGPFEFGAAQRSAILCDTFGDRPQPTTHLSWCSCNACSAPMQIELKMQKPHEPASCDAMH